MPTTWLVLDVNYLAHRALYTTGGLAHAGAPTGVLFGIFREVATLTERFETPHVVFCFDHHHTLRQEYDPQYKQNRRDRAVKRSAEEESAYNGMRDQVWQLKDGLLKDVGYRNVFFQPGYEADDVIAAVCANKSVPVTDQLVVVSADTDMFQLLCPRVRVFHPTTKALTDEATFRRQHFNLRPSQWAEVKAIAGDSADNVPGVAGVGLVTACQYLTGQLAPGGAKAAAISKWVTSERYHQNVRLVTLPWPGVRPFQPTAHPPVTPAQWQKVLGRFGITSLESPGGDRAWRGGISRR